MKKNYIDQLLLEEISTEQKKNKELKGNNVFEFNTNLKNYSDVLDDYYILNKLRIISNHLNNISIAHTDKQPFQLKDFLFAKEIMSLISKRKFTNPSIQLFIEIIDLQKRIGKKKTNVTFSDLSAIENYLQLHAGEIEPRDKITAYFFIANLSIHQLNKGNLAFKEKLFLAHNESLNIRYGQLKSKEKLTATFYRNIYRAAFSLADHPLFKSIKTFGFKKNNQSVNNGLVWAENFLSYYKRHLTKKDQSTHRYCLASLAMHQNNPEKALLALGTVQRVRGRFINMTIKQLYLKIAFELLAKESKIIQKERLIISKVLEAYRKLIEDDQTRKHELTYQLDNYIVFISNYRKLYNFFIKYHGLNYNYKNQSFVNKKTKLLEEFNTHKTINTKWFIQKLEAIE